MNYKVKETFLSIQGEGPFAGRTAWFIRLSDCPLACTWCDTDFDGGDRSSCADLVFAAQLALQAKHEGLVVITGGEPMAQPIGELCVELLRAGLEVQVETSGCVWTPLPTHPKFSLVVSPKTTVHAEVRARAVAWKYVIRWDEEMTDFGAPITDTQGNGTKKALPFPNEGDSVPVYYQPCEEGPGEEGNSGLNVTRCVNMAQLFGYRVSLQQHKIMGLR